MSDRLRHNTNLIYTFSHSTDTWAAPVLGTVLSPEGVSPTQRWSLPSRGVPSHCNGSQFRVRVKTERT